MVALRPPGRPPSGIARLAPQLIIERVVLTSRRLSAANGAGLLGTEPWPPDPNPLHDPLTGVVRVLPQQDNPGLG